MLDWNRIILIAIFWLVISVVNSVVANPAIEIDFKAQASGWTQVVEHNTQLGLRYIPELSVVKYLSPMSDVSAEVAAHTQAYRNFNDLENATGEEEINSYRMWFRYASTQFELRAGQQKISFGSATLLRPLMWFDSIDPRDPLQFTTGVYGLLGRYFYLNNANVWLWGLYGNKDLKGWETIPGEDSKIEFGGRVQLPTSRGDIAFSFHQRTVDPQGSNFGELNPAQGDFQEHRLGLDGKWDVGVGLWCEATIVHQDFDLPDPQLQRQLTAGTDYTFNIGNGPHVLFEQHMISDAEDILESGGSRFTSALSGDYPIGLLDAVSLIVYYDWERKTWSRFAVWQRSYDAWQVLLSGFWNSETQASSTDNFETYSNASKGVQIMLVFNH